MKKQLITILLVMLTMVTFGQQWVATGSDIPSTIQTTLVSSSENQITVNLQVPGFYTVEVTTPRGEANIISVPKTVSTATASEPNLPMIAIPTIISDRALMRVEVVASEFTDFENIEVAPSKGDFPRSIDPNDVPYTYGEAYATDAFFPSAIVTLDEPYIHRDVRGQNMMVVPFQYNPVTKVLRVYNRLTLSMVKDGNDNRNIIENRTRNFTLNPEFKAIYENRYINYNESISKYTPIEEAGELLIICHDAFMTEMEPFVNWKKQIGRPTTMVGTSTTGTTASSIQSYISTYYSQHPALTDVLLVGDVAQIPGVYVSAGSGYSGYSGYGDLPYGQTAGNDSYNELLVGRFCCETAAQVTNHVNKVINYERDLNQTATWLPVGQGISTTAGSGGHYNEDDYQHVDNLRTDLLNYNYTDIYRDYQSVSGSTASNANAVSQHINNGVSIINYCNHGSETSWGVFNYSNSNVNALTNDYKLPYIISVACLVGKYDHNGSCFAEAWMRATNNSNGNPTGAIGGMFSYISQPWVPPMYGQDEMVDILVESYNNQIRRTMGGVSIDGNMKVLDLGATQNANKGTYNCWILYGDPTLTLRNAIPQDMNVTHAPSMSTNATSFTVNATNGDGALATLTRNNEIMGSATISNGTANITFDAPGTTGTATLTVFGYNMITYIATIDIVGGGVTEYTINVSANPEEGGAVSGGGTYQQGQSCTVNATPATNYTFTNWTENGSVVSTNASYTFNVTGNRTLVANFTYVPQNFNITVSANPTNGGTVTGGGTYQEGESCTVNATPATNYTFTNWTENGSVVSTNASYTFNVTENRTLVANFTYVPQNFNITVSASPSEGGIVTGGGTYSQDQSCTLTATPNEGYTFVKWTKNGTQVSTNASYTFNVTASEAYVAHFQLISYNISVMANPADGGTVTGDGAYQLGQSCTVSATPNEGYAFSNWMENNNVVSTNANYTFTVTGNHYLTANFEALPNTYTISVEATPTEGGNVTGGGTFTEGQSCTVNASPNAVYTFVNWTENGNVVSTNASYTFNVTGNRTLVANFTYVPQNFNITVSANPTNGGTVTGGGTYQEGESCTVNATPAEGYVFVNWTEDDAVVSSHASYIFTVTGNRTLTANFELKTLKITTWVDPIGAASITGDGTYTYGDEVTLTVIPNEDYAFQNWTEGSEVVSEELVFTFIATESHSFVAHLLHTEGLIETAIHAMVYPNPTQGEVTVECEGLNHVRIVNAYGQTVYSADLEGEQARIDLSQMAKGIYMMHIEAEGGQVMRKIVVE